MDDVKKHTNSLVIIALLVCIKFVLLPIITWQEDLIQQVNLKERKLAKSEQLITSKEVLFEKEKELSLHLLSLKNIFYLNTEPEKLKRELQKVIERKLKSNNIRIETIGWKATSEHDVYPLTKIQLDFRVKGKAIDIFNYLISIESENKSPDIYSLNLIFNTKKVGELGSLNARVSLIFYISSYELNETQLSNLFQCSQQVGDKIVTPWFNRICENDNAV